MTGDKPKERGGPALTLQQGAERAFVVTASELLDRKLKRRREQYLLGRPEAIRWLVKLGLKAKGK
jgi:hypothetical protein